MELWQTKQKHVVRKNREFHRIQMVIPAPDVKYIKQGIAFLEQAPYNVPDVAILSVRDGWNNTWLEATWTITPYDKAKS